MQFLKAAQTENTDVLVLIRTIATTTIILLTTPFEAKENEEI